jgi:hypothetical protein
MKKNITEAQVRRKRNTKAATYCKGCVWLHIGINVDHNHCDYNTNETGGEWNDYERRVNGILGILSPKCRFFWAKKLSQDINHAFEGVFYNAPKGLDDLCPVIPKTKRRSELPTS